jgi:hypothetical protein
MILNMPSTPFLSANLYRRTALQHSFFCCLSEESDMATNYRTIKRNRFWTQRQCCGSVTIFFGSGSYVTSKKFRIQFRIRP